MKEFTAEVETLDGVMPTFVAHPEGDGPFAPVIAFMDIWGVREELRAIARRIAGQGYCCLLPDLYYRQGGVATGFRDADGRMISLHRLDEERTRQVRAPRDKVNGAMLMQDTAALLDYMAAVAWLRPGPVGTIGWCMGGWVVLSAAGRIPDRLTANACLHGTRLISDAAESPHLLADKLRGELYCGFGERDHFSPPELIAALAALFEPCAVDYSCLVHQGAEHGYALPDRDIYDQQAAERDWQHIFAMYRRQLTGD